VVVIRTEVTLDSRPYRLWNRGGKWQKREADNLVQLTAKLRMCGAELPRHHTPSYRDR
jgi:hypothetical protein